ATPEIYPPSLHDALPISHSDNHSDAAQLALLMQTLDTFPHPTMAIVQGSAFGGALGLICCCDIALAAPNARFCLSEVRLGLIPRSEEHTSELQSRENLVC